MTGRARRFFVIGVSLAVAGTTVVAHADRLRKEDGNDTSSQLDFGIAVHGHEGDALKHRLTMRRKWGKRHLADGRHGPNFITLFFSTDRDKGFERRILVDVREGRYIAPVTDWQRRERVGEANVARPSRRTMTLTFDPGLLGSDVSSYRWEVNSFFHTNDSGPCGMPNDVSVTCYDRVPNKGFQRHGL